MKFNFQTILLAVMGIAVIVAVGIFASSGNSGSMSGGKPSGLVHVKVWGTFPAEEGAKKAFTDLAQRNYKTVSIEYVYKEPASFSSEFVQALALDKTTGSNNAPDLLLIRNDQVLGLEKFIAPIPYQKLSLQAYGQSYAAASSAFLGRSGVLAIPILLDPVVLYSHKDLLTNASLVSAPMYWDELIGLQDKLTKRDGSTFNQSMIPIGAYTNVTHAKDIIATMMLQSGVPILARNNGNPGVDLQSQTGKGEQPAVSILRFWTDFADPLKSTYSWNSLQTESLKAFASEKVALYPGLASDYDQLARLNAHLNFGVSQIPQFRGAKAEVTGGSVWGLAMVQKGSTALANESYALGLATSDTQFVTDWSKTSMLPPARLDLIKNKPADPVVSVFYDAALRMRTWLDPDTTASNMAFGTAVDGISSGRFTPSAAVSSINTSLNDELAKIQ